MKDVKKHQLTNAVMVGDRLSDFHAAKANGLIAIGCRFDFAREEELAQANYVIDHLLEIKAIFSELEAVMLN